MSSFKNHFGIFITALPEKMLTDVFLFQTSAWSRQRVDREVKVARSCISNSESRGHPRSVQKLGSSIVL